jgi:hypothetical protein
VIFSIVEVIQDVALEVFRIIGIVVLRVVADNDVGTPHRVLDEADLRKSFHWMCNVRTWPP